MINLLRERLDQSATARFWISVAARGITLAFAEALPESPRLTADVAKTAIKAAAKRYSQVKFCAAPLHRLPCRCVNGCGDRIYAPCKAQELARVAKPGGWVVTTPGPHHPFEPKGSFMMRRVYMRRIPSSSSDSHCSRVPALLITCSSPSK